MDILTLLPIGIVTGIISGYFGVGGGAILVPILLLFGVDMKSAISISILQMFMSSIYGTYLNNKKANIDFKDVGFVALGGFFGAQGSVYVISVLSDFSLQIMLLIFLLLSILKLNKKIKPQEAKIDVSPLKLFLIGAPIGLFAMSVGVGGALMLIPVLVSFFGYSTQRASITGLLFVLFASFSGVIGLGISGELLIEEGLTTGLGALIGVKIGVNAIHKSSASLHKKLLMGLYLLVMIIVLYKIISV